MKCNEANNCQFRNITKEYECGLELNDAIFACPQIQKAIAAVQVRDLKPPTAEDKE